MRSDEHPFPPLPRLLEQGIHSDVVFVVHGKPFRAHRCVLGARSTYFANMLDTKWKGKSVVVLRHPLVRPSGWWRGVDCPGDHRACAAVLPLTCPLSSCSQINPLAFGALLQYLYTGEPPVLGREGEGGRDCLSAQQQTPWCHGAMVARHHFSRGGLVPAASWVGLQDQVCLFRKTLYQT